MGMGRRMGMNNSDVVIQHLEKQLVDYQKSLNEAQGKTKVLKDCLSTIAEKICDDEYGNGQLGGKNQILGLSDYELRDFIIQNFYSQREKLANNIIKLQKMYYSEADEKDRISEQYLELQEEYKHLQAKYNNLEYDYQMLEKTRGPAGEVQQYIKQNMNGNIASASGTPVEDSFEEPTYSDYSQDSFDSLGKNDAFEVPDNRYTEIQHATPKQPMSQPQTTPMHTTQERERPQNNIKQRPQPSRPQPSRPQPSRNQTKINEPRNNRGQEGHGQKSNPSTLAQQSNNRQSQVKQPQKKTVYYNGRPVDLQKKLQDIDIFQRKLLWIMGTTGLNEAKELEAECMKYDEFAGTSKFPQILKLAKENGIVEELSNPIASRPKLTLNYISELGKSVYRALFKEMPVKDEMTRIQSMHDNLNHGYCIKDVYNILQEQGYENVSMDPRKNTIAIGSNQYIPDVTADINLNGKSTKTYWEIELGNHHDNDFFDKLEKAAKVTNTVYIIADKLKTKEHLKKQIDNFMLNLRKTEKKLQLVIVYGTIKELKDKALLTSKENRIVVKSGK